MYQADDGILYKVLKVVGRYLGVPVPDGMRLKTGTLRGGVLDGKGTTLMVDQCLPTIEPIAARRPDLVVETGRKTIP